MTSSRIFAAQNALLALAQTTFADTTVIVYDGPQPTVPTQKDYLVVGCDDVLGSDMVQAVTSGAQEWLSISASQKNETFSILSTYVTWTGSNDFSILRANASTNIGLLEAALRPPLGDTRLGTPASPGPLGPPGWCNLAIRDTQVIADKDGTAMHVVLSVDCWTRI